MTSGMQQPRAGMTLMEILAVVVILGLIATTLTVGITARMAKARRELAKTQVMLIAGQVQTYEMDQHVYPTVTQGLAQLSTPASAPTDAWFLEPAQLLDPWGRPYVYLVPGPQGRPFEVITYGSDGQPGGTGDAADISSAGTPQGNH